MSGVDLRQRRRERCWLALERASTLYPEADLRRPAIVFSPHFDDETLGCGGTIIKKTRAGAGVSVVFMTDGSTSHAQLMPKEELRAIRAREGIAAAGALGIDAAAVHLLGVEEARLSERRDAAMAAVTQILSASRPDEIFVPYEDEPRLWSDDHVATTEIVCSAVRRCGLDATLYEYPIWFWFHWPWVPIRISHVREVREIVRQTRRYRCGARLAHDFDCRVEITDVAATKRVALERHRSQMTPLLPQADWTTLEDVAGGDFLRCFFHTAEVFRRRRIRGGTVIPHAVWESG